MPESRDRLTRPVDHAARFASRRSGSMGILIDEPDTGTNPSGSPVPRMTATSLTTTVRAPVGLGATRGGGSVRGSFRTPRTAGFRRGRNIYAAVGRENMVVGSSGGGRGRQRRVLPSWYPRTPLRDITAVARAIQRTRARLEGIEGQETESPVPQEQRVDPSRPVSSALPEHTSSLISPISSTASQSVGKVPKILQEIANQNVGESEFVTPQKKLLNSIDEVEKAVMEELQKLKRTPSAKKAVREKKIGEDKRSLYRRDHSLFDDILQKSTAPRRVIIL